MNPTKFTDNIRQALQQNPGKAIPVEDDQTHRVYFVYTEDLHLKATEALRAQEDLAAIQAGIDAMEAGRTIPLAEADKQIREELGFRPR